MAARSLLENSIGPKSWFRTSEQKMLSSFSAIWLDKPMMMLSMVSLVRKSYKNRNVFLYLTDLFLEPLAQFASKNVYFKWANPGLFI